MHKYYKINENKSIQNKHIHNSNNFNKIRSFSSSTTSNDNYEMINK
jgi:hypothetical protein